MNSEKLRLILEDDHRQRKRMRERSVNTPTWDQKIDHPYQFKELKKGAKDEKIYGLSIPSDRAVVVKELANEWYADIELDLIIDGEKRVVNRSIAPMDNPKDVEFLAREQIEWRGTNNKDSARTIGVITDGHYVPVEYFDGISEIHDGVSRISESFH